MFVSPAPFPRGFTLEMDAAHNSLTTAAYSGVPSGAFVGSLYPKHTYASSGYLAQQHQLFRTQAETATLKLPDASGGDTGEGFTCTGLAWDGENYIIGSDGTSKETESPQVHLCGLVKVSPAGVNVGEIRIDTLYSLGTGSSVQGIAIDPTDGSYWVAVDTAGIKHVSAVGAALSGSFLPGFTPNGLAIDSLRDQILISGLGTLGHIRLDVYDRATRAFVATYDFGPDGTGGGADTFNGADHLYYDAARDYLWVTSAMNGNPGLLTAFHAADFTRAGGTTLPNATAIEGLIIKDGEFVVCHDGYFHGFISGATPTENQLQFYPAVDGINQTDWALDYNPLTHALRGFLFEAEYASLADPLVLITGTSCTVTQNNALSPMGTLDAQTVTAAATTEVHEINRGGAKATVATGATCIVSDIVAAGTYTGNLWFGDRGDTSIHSATVNISTGAVVGTSNCTCAVEDMGGGYFRVTRTYPRLGAAGNIGANIAFTGVAHVTDRVAGALAGTETFRLWAHDVGSADFPTSPVNKSLTGVAGYPIRTADAVAWADVAWLSASANTFIFEGTTAPGKSSGVNQVMFQVDDGSESNRYRLVRDGTGHLRFIVTVAGVEQCNLDMGVVADATSFRLAVSAAANGFAASLNGGAAVTDVSGSLPSVTTTRVGGSFTGEQWNGWVKRLTADAVDVGAAGVVVA